MEYENASHQFRRRHQAVIAVSCISSVRFIFCACSFRFVCVSVDCRVWNWESSDDRFRLAMCELMLAATDCDSHCVFIRVYKSFACSMYAFVFILMTVALELAAVEWHSHTIFEQSGNVRNTVHLTQSNIHEAHHTHMRTLAAHTHTRTTHTTSHTRKHTHAHTHLYTDTQTQTGKWLILFIWIIYAPESCHRYDWIWVRAARTSIPHMHSECLI